MATIGVDFKVKSLNIQDKIFRMQIWDTAGQERFQNITQAYYKNTAGIILTYAINDDESFRNISRWMTQIEDSAPEDSIKILVGTKSDLNDDRRVTFD